MVTRHFYIFLLVAIALLRPSVSSAGDPLGDDRTRMKYIAAQVSKDIEKNFYDPKMNGLDWQAVTQQAKEKIDKANSIGEMMTAIFVMVDKLHDSHTFFYPPARNVSYKFGFEAKPIGDKVFVYEIKPKGAAEKAGLKVGDQLISVNNYPAERRGFDTMMIYMRVLRPVPVMELKVQSAGQPEAHIVHLTPEIDQHAVVLDVKERPGDIWDLLNENINARREKPFEARMYEGGVGYIQIRSFEASSGFLTGIAEKVKDAKAVVVDVRGNGGGLLDSLRDFSGLFQSEQTDMAKVNYRGKSDTISVKPRKPAFTGPMFVLIDSHSFSASEMFAKHFQLSKRATIIGDRSEGKVTSARFFDEQYGGDRAIFYAVEIGMGKVIFPDGQDLEGVGVSPDIACIPTSKDIADGHDVCLDRAVSEARKALNIPEKVAFINSDK